MFGFVLFTGVLLACRGEPLTAPVLASSCGGELRDDAGFLGSPFQGHSYPPNTDCIWTIKANGTFKWRLEFFLYFELQGKNSSGHCANDYVEVRDGGDSSAKILAKYCGVYTVVDPVSVLSSGNQMWIKFHSDSEKEFPGFIAQYSIEYICGGELREESGHLRSPLMRSSNVYPSEIQCNWKINVDGASKLTLNFTFFELEGTNGTGKCFYDYVEVGDGEKVGMKPLGKYCGEKKPFHVVANGGKMWIKFTSDYTESRKGFSAKYWKGGLDEDEPSDKLKPNES